MKNLDFTKKYIIGITGKKSSGKSLTADYLQSEFGFEQFAFADKLKSGIISIFDVPNESLYGSEVEKNKLDEFWGVSGRQLAQIIGSELFRDILPTLLPQLNNIWIRCIEKKILNSKSDLIVISDVRFSDEAEFIKSMGGVIISIERNNLNIIDKHQSETQIINADYTVDNNYTIDELFEKINNIVKIIL